MTHCVCFVWLLLIGAIPLANRESASAVTIQSAVLAAQAMIALFNQPFAQWQMEQLIERASASVMSICQSVKHYRIISLIEATDGLCGLCFSALPDWGHFVTILVCLLRLLQRSSLVYLAPCVPVANVIVEG